MEESIPNDGLMGAATYFLLFVSGLIFLFLERNNKFVRFHAMQSTMVFGLLTFVSFLLGILPVIGFFFSMIINLVIFVLWIVLMIKAFHGDYYKLPYIGDLAEEKMDSFNF